MRGEKKIVSIFDNIYIGFLGFLGFVGCFVRNNKINHALNEETIISSMFVKQRAILRQKRELNLKKNERERET